MEGLIGASRSMCMLTRGIDHTPDEMSLDPDYDLADLLVGFHIAMRLDNLRQRKSLIDTRLEIAYCEMVEDLLLGLGEDRGVRHYFEKRVAADG